MENRHPEVSSVDIRQTSLYNPLVSIITPVRNGIKYLQTCIQSVLNQTYPNIEHIFVDGGSIDGTLEMLASYQSKYRDRIRFISEPDKGVGEAVNKGLKIAKGEIFGWIDSDDLYEPDAIQTVVDFFRANPDACFVFGRCYMVNEEGETITEIITKDFNFHEAINDRHYIVFCAAFYKREVIEKVGYFNTLGNDLDFWLRVGQVFKLHRIDKALSKWRLHEGSISGSKGTAQARIRKTRIKEDYVICKRYGAGIFSPRARRYYRFVILDTLHLYPLVNRIYPVVRRVLGRG